MIIMRISFKRLFGEPLVQFFILGVLLFLLTSYIRQYKDKQSREIIVDNERIGMMVMNYKTQTGYLPNKQQLDAMIENYIREEISYREAKKIGLDKDDEIIRRRLSQKFNFLQTDLTEAAQPSDKDLKQFYDQHFQMFQKEVTVSFSHIYFTADNSTDNIAKQKALNVLEQLKNSKLQRAPGKGDRFPLQYDYTDQAAIDIQQNFGDKPILQELFKAPLHKWIGPVQSGYGWHLIFISKRNNAAAITFESIKEDVKTKWLEEVKAAQNKKVFDQLNEKYIINRKYLETK
jgi:parvulin-like peptidyl-prolyl isomerase